MRLYLTICLVLAGFSAYTQVTIIQPRIQYVSKWDLESINWMNIGDRVLFKQECTTSLPPEFPTGVVFFENVFHQEELFSMAVEFKDTVVVSVTYYLDAKQQEFLKTIGYADIKANGSAVKGQWTYTVKEDKRSTVIVGDRKRIVVIQTL